jgi:hypothetical protein
MRCYRSLTVAAQLQVDAATVKKLTSRSLTQRLSGIAFLDRMEPGFDLP